ncbi:hypothetical protein PYCCODRAFT_1426955 [Trametes coccinea BRFM310]|uniref:Fungal-type protein kinase domain-containing protein n=1 Tax=Trametes coccinea (strain BRFM310) TaxID=1353009 RepID=A0A1Y2IF98_TRAC3|nr:hypothetical protein PYCCODRAFT_1426955 [Trametes coccinea BRFM310]
MVQSVIIASNSTSTLDGVRHDRSHPIERIYDGLRPLHELTEDDFIAAWFQILDAHHRAWLSGIQHKDVRLCNLMHYRRPDHSIGAMLLDWDHSLRHIGSEDEPMPAYVEARMPDAVPFLAIDLLTSKVLKGSVPVLYRHALEAFIWVLIWAVCCYRHGKMVYMAPRGFHKWDLRDPISCGVQKAAFISQNKPIIPASDGWVYGAKLAKHLAMYLIHKDTARAVKHKAAYLRWLNSSDGSTFPSLPTSDQPEDDPEREWSEFWTWISGLRKHVPCIAEFMPRDLPKAKADENKQ